MKLMTGKEMYPKLKNLLDIYDVEKTYIVSPFLGGAANEVLDLVEDSDITMVTTSKGEKYLYEQGIWNKVDKLIVNDKTHAKGLYVETSEGINFGYVGSSNLSTNGMKNNNELNVIFSNMTSKTFCKDFRDFVLNMKVEKIDRRWDWYKS